MTTRARMLAALAALALGACGSGDPDPPAPASEPSFEERLMQSCTTCHTWSPPAVLPRASWRAKLAKMYKLANTELRYDYAHPIEDPPLEEAVAWFEERAPEALDAPSFAALASPNPLAFEERVLGTVPTHGPQPGISNLQVFELFEAEPGPELIVCDMLAGWVAWGSPAQPEQELEGLVRLSHPGHAEPADLDGDGVQELLVAELGDARPTDRRVGAVAWVKLEGAGAPRVQRLLSGLGRVADARAGDMDGDGDQDVVVGEFGWLRTGGVHLLLNGGGAQPEFESRVLDERSGSIHVPLVDLDGDARLDVVALLSQEVERVVFLRNEPAGSTGEPTFAAETLWRAPHPHWGFSGMEPADMDLDGDLDFVLTNGDTLDDDVQFKPYQGVAWIEQREELVFVRHSVATYYGVHRAEPGDLDGDGDIDLVATSFLPALEEATRLERGLPGVVWFEQGVNGRFESHTLADVQCNRPTAELVDYDGDGLLDVVTGTWNLEPGTTDPRSGRVEMWRQLPR